VGAISRIEVNEVIMNVEQFSEFGQNAGYVNELFQLYRTDPTLVEPRWGEYFERIVASNGIDNGGPAPSSSAAVNHSAGVALSLQERVSKVIAAYRTRGHLKAKVNPLTNAVSTLREARDLDIENYGFTEQERLLSVRSSGFMHSEELPVGAILRDLESIYCGTIGFEYEHLTNAEEREWLRSRIEVRRSAGYGFSADARRRMLSKLIESEALESELHKKYVGAKRFSVQGGETLIPVIDRLLEVASVNKVRELVIGMAHRGRLGVLTLNCQKPIAELFSEFEDRTTSSVVGQGDVKYHLGHRAQVATSGGEMVGIQLLPNPSHLEAVNPVVEGVCRARQDREFGGDRRSALPVLVHGDAAVMGQGIVPETFNMSLLRGYSAGGTVHIVVNNQVGFTTNPDEGRSSNYCTEWAKGAEAPIFHVNGDDVEGASWISELALEFRTVFGRDVMIDLVCWRRYGHNEADDPTFTQPLMYGEIKDLKPIYVGYAEQLSGAGVVTPDFAEEVLGNFRTGFTKAQERAQQLIVGAASPLFGKLGAKPTPIRAVAAAELEEIANTIVTFPDGFTPYPKLKQINAKRVEALREGTGIEWGLAETLAFGSILRDGVSIRLSGQDAGRATFSHRHLQIRDFEGKGSYFPLQSLPESRGSFEVFNSPLSEEAVMGFEFGFAYASPSTLVLWEAQFGDFSNGAQIQIDQFLSSSEAKWNQCSGITLLLPHGQEGQGPEHSSARLERYLQLCAAGNMMVAYPTKASQYFHLLRRQAHLKVKRPLIVMTPKSLLRAPAAMATREELTSGSWAPVISDDFGDKKSRAVTVLCTGKIFYDIQQALEKSKRSARVLRLEQLYPFPEREVQELLLGGKGKGASKVVWVQEEPKNMGAWQFAWSNLAEAGIDATYIGRPAAPSPAAGSGKFFTAEQGKIVQDLLTFLE
jgi:2-oxoglutarate dehydrogenase E1 component